MKNKRIFYIVFVSISFILTSFIPLIPNMKDFHYIFPIIEFGIIFLIYNHFQISKLSKTQKKRDFDIEKYNQRRKTLIICMLISILFIIYGIILYNAI